MVLTNIYIFTYFHYQYLVLFSHMYSRYPLSVLAQREFYGAGVSGVDPHFWVCILPRESYVVRTACCAENNCGEGSCSSLRYVYISNDGSTGNAIDLSGGSWRSLRKGLMLSSPFGLFCMEARVSRSLHMTKVLLHVLKLVHSKPAMFRWLEFDCLLGECQ